MWLPGGLNLNYNLEEIRCKTISGGHEPPKTLKAKIGCPTLNNNSERQRTHHQTLSIMEFIPGSLEHMHLPKLSLSDTL